MTEGIVQKVISKYLSLYDSPEPESKKLMYYLEPLMNDLQQELIEEIKQVCSNTDEIGCFCSRLIGDTK